MKILRIYFLIFLLALAPIQSIFASSGVPLVPPKLQFFSAVGVPLSGGQVFSYYAGTTTPLATYTDATLGTPNSNPVILDSGGMANIWLGNNSYKIVVEDSQGNVISTTDNIPGAGVIAGGTIAGNLSVSGTSIFTGGATLNGGVTVNGTSNLVGAVSVTGNLSVSGSVSATGLTGVGAHGYDVTLSGVKCDGSTDDTANLNAAFSTAGSGAVVVFPGRTCLVSGTLIPASGQTIIGNGTTLKLATTTSLSPALRLFDLSNLSNVTISGLNINGQKEYLANLPQTPGPSAAYMFAFYLNSSNYNYIHDIQFQEWGGYGINNQAGNYNKFVNLYFLNCGNRRDNAISDTYGNDNAADAVFLGGTVAGASHNLVENVTWTVDSSVVNGHGPIAAASSGRAIITVDSGSYNTIRNIKGGNISRLIHLENDASTYYVTHNIVQTVNDDPTYGNIDHAVIVNVFGSTDHFGDNIVEDLHSTQGRRTVNSVANTAVVYNGWSTNTFDNFEFQLRNSFLGVGNIYMAGTNITLDTVQGGEINGGASTPFYQSTINNYTGTFIWLPGANHGLTVSNSFFTMGSSNTCYVSAGAVALTSSNQINRWVNNTFVSSNTGASLLTVTAPTYLLGNTFEYAGSGTNTNAFIHLNGIVTLNSLNFPTITQNNAFIADTNAMSALYLADGGTYFLPETSNVIVGTMVTGYIYNYGSATVLGSYGYLKTSIVNGGTASVGPTTDSNGNLNIPAQKSSTGTRYLCIGTGGQITSSASACSGT